MRRGFTLVELLIVVVVIVTLMAITFRLGSAGSDTSARSKTINKMQRLENCLSGYYAAYGSYPPVQLHGSRDYTLSVNMQGIQQVGNGSGNGSHESDLSWESVEAACRSQPIGVEFPFSDANFQKYVDTVSQEQQKRASSDDPKYKRYKDNPALAEGYVALVDNGPIAYKSDKDDWTDNQVFKFGVLSYILPRYLVMMNVVRSGNSANVETIYTSQTQWNNNNRCPCDFETGAPYSGWGQVIAVMKDERWKIAALPSQSVCARWIQNLEGIVSCQTEREIFGVKIRDNDVGAVHGVSVDNVKPHIYGSGNSQGGKGSNGGQQYILDGMSIHDGWGEELYYYSPSPHQSYIIWSSGPNRRTFPPWVDDKELKAMKPEDFNTVQTWIADDIRQMSN